MSTLELIILAVGLSMDAFAVSICKGLSVAKVKTSHVLAAGLWFGGFQALMPVIGYYLVSSFTKYIQTFDHWVAFILLLIIGLNMLKESRHPEQVDDDFSFKTMLVMAVATSIDAMSVGISFAFLPVNLWLAVTVIGVTTFIFSAVGIMIGHAVGCRFGAKVKVIGGLILIGIGVKILAEHMGWL